MVVIEKILSISDLKKDISDVKDSKDWIEMWLNGKYDMSELHIDSIISIEDNDVDQFSPSRNIKYNFNTSNNILTLIGTDFLMKQGKQNLKIRYYYLSTIS